MLFMGINFKTFFLVFAFTLSYSIVMSQDNKYDITGCWLELSKSKYPKLEICLLADSSAEYPSRYPENSEDLYYSVENNKLLLYKKYIIDNQIVIYKKNVYEIRFRNENKLEIKMIYPYKESKRILKKYPLNMEKE